MTASPSAVDSAQLRRGDQQRQHDDVRGAIQAYTEAIQSVEVPPGDVCLRLARCHDQLSEHDAALRWLCRIADAPDDFRAWQAGAALLTKILSVHQPVARREANAALLGAYTLTQWTPMLRLAALRHGVLLDCIEAPYGQYRQQILDSSSETYASEPDFIVLAPHAGETVLPGFADEPEEAVATELSRWTGLWSTARDRCSARVLMHNFAVPPETPMGHLSTRLAGSRASMLRQLNARLGEVAGNDVLIVDAERLAGDFGRKRWFDPRYWHLSKQAVALDALPLLARHTAAVVAADLGLSRKCLVLDLDNTLWGGVVGEDGLANIRLGQGAPEGEAFLALQQYVLELKNKGVILAVCSKNNEADALEPFEKHPDMLLTRDDIAMFVANWETKPQNLRRIAETLNIGLDALVFLDDNPGEREIVRQMLPEIEVITLPPDPALYVRALDDFLMFETSTFTIEDAQKTEQYRAKAAVAELEAGAESIEDFYGSLNMQAVIAPFDELHLPRIVQLIGKTNQFNLTTRRHNLEAVRAFMADPDCVHVYLKLSDRFADHGLVALAIAMRDGDVLDIDTWLMSCRVIGRTVEDAMLARLGEEATRLGCTKLRGTYLPTAKNPMVSDVYGKFGFVSVDRSEEMSVWEYDLAQGPVRNRFISLAEDAGDAA